MRNCLVFVLSIVLANSMFAAPVSDNVSNTVVSRPPNIIVVLIDDMGWGDFSCFGNKTVQTPNIDSLAAEGVRFEQFYVAMPICSPSRCGLTTGQYPHRWRITSFLEARNANARNGQANWLDVQAPTLARCLHDNGYATGHFGKWHLGGQRDVGDAPLITEYGFDRSLTNFEGLGPRVLPLLDTYDGSVARKMPLGLGSEKLGRGPIHWENRSYITQSFVTETVQFIQKAKQENKPFYVNVWPDDVHSPFFPPKELRTSEEKRALYHAVLKAMDNQLGVLFDTIRNDPELCNNTMILVFSDNGPEEGAGSAGPFRGFKGTLYEGGIRSPLVVWGNGLLAREKAGTVNRDAVFMAIDLAPSLLNLVKIKTNIAFDGEDFSSVLTAKTHIQSRKAPLFWRRPPNRPGTPSDRWPDLAVRSENWKLMMQIDGTAVQLYDLNRDRGETTNVAKENPNVVTRLQTQLKEWNATLPQDGVALGEIDERLVRRPEYPWAY